MMDCRTKLEQLWAFFARVTLLSDRNGDKVWRVRHRATEKDYVLKLLGKKNEIYQTLCAGRCEHLPAVYEVYELEDGLIVLEEYIEGLTVAEVAQTGRYTKRGAVHILRQLCIALSALHRNGIVHRDVKPENVMVDKDGRVVLIDFNAARRIMHKSCDTEVMGTVGYASPEQLGLSESDERTDIYAAGVLLNILLTGKFPSVEMARGHLGRVVQKCTSVNPADRYPTARKLYQAL